MRMRLGLSFAIALFLAAVPLAQDAPQSTANSDDYELILLLNQKLSDAAAACEAGNWHKAIAILEEATSIAPSRDLIWFKLGDAYRGAKRYHDAATAYNKAIAIKPLGPYYNNLGEVEGKGGNAREAVEAYRNAARTDPANAARYYFNIGAVQINAGELDEANEAYDNAIREDPGFSPAYYFKGLNLLSESQTNNGRITVPYEASMVLEKYLELAPEGTYAATSQELLDFIHKDIVTTYSHGANPNQPSGDPRPTEVSESVPQGTIDGFIVHKVQPIYPTLARHARIQGTVVLDAVIEKDGTVFTLSVFTGNPFLAEAAIAAVKDWKYKPYKVRNQPVEVQTQILVNFALSSDAGQ